MGSKRQSIFSNEGLKTFVKHESQSLQLSHHSFLGGGRCSFSLWPVMTEKERLKRENKVLKRELRLAQKMLAKLEKALGEHTPTFYGWGKASRSMHTTANNKEMHVKLEE